MKHPPAQAPTEVLIQDLPPETGETLPPPLLTYLSLGWGIQSFCLAAMAATGFIPPFDLAIHADTGHEALGTYQHAEKWTPWLEERGLKVVTVSAAAAVRDISKPDRQGVFIPAATVSHRNGSLGRLSRQCTERWKIRPIKDHLKTILGRRPKPNSINALLGISLDEFHRMRSSDVSYIINTYPLVDLRMTRGDCISWLQQHQLDVPPKSACVFCPYHDRAAWKSLKRAGGPDWDKALYVDQALRHRRPNHDLYLHPVALPLEQAVKIPEDFGGTQVEMDIPCSAATCFV